MSSNQRKNLLIFFLQKIKFYKKTRNTKVSKERKLILFFWFIFFIILFRVFWLQIVQQEYYNKMLISQHYTKSLLKAKRWNIYLIDRSGKEMKLTENVDLYNVYVDPKFVTNKSKLIKVVAPVLYKHFCELNGLSKPTKEECIQNVEKYTNAQILPSDDKMFYMSGDQQVILTLDEYNEQRQKVIDEFSGWQAIELIGKKLDDMIKTWIREKNYLWFFDNDKLLAELKKKKFSYIEINTNYIYIIPSKSLDKQRDSKDLYDLFKFYWYSYTEADFYSNLTAKEIRYIKIVDNINSQIAKDLKELKDKYYSDKYDWIPLLHGLWLEKTEIRYYPYGSFLSNVLGYVDRDWNSFYGIEKYFDDDLKGKDGDMIWLSVPWLGEIWSNSIDISNPVDWYDVYLTIDPVIQKETERVIKWRYNTINPDSISVIIMDPFSGKIITSMNYPNFDPNFYEDIYKIKPLTPEDRIIVDNDSYVDIPVLVLKDWKLQVATYDDRKDPSLKKYLFKNKLWPQTFVDKVISFPYEPGSIFKSFTLAIWMDSDELSMYDHYLDPKWYITVWPYKMSNVAKECTWKKTFLDALERSCNVGMVKIWQKIWQNVYYSYLNRLGLWQRTWVELYGEDEWSLGTDTSLAKFYNNTFGQWLLVTPIQMAVGYSSLLNGWYLLKPTIVEKMYDKENNKYINFEKKILSRVFTQKTSDDMKEALYQVINEWDLNALWVSGYTLWWKTWTAQLAFKWRYLGWAWFTNGSFVWMVSKENLKYVMVIQIKRPRNSQWWLTTAGKIFTDLAKFVISYDGIQK